MTSASSAATGSAATEGTLGCGRSSGAACPVGDPPGGAGSPGPRHPQTGGRRAGRSYRITEKGRAALENRRGAPFQRPGMYRVWIDAWPVAVFVIAAGIGFWVVIGGLAWLVYSLIP